MGIVVDRFVGPWIRAAAALVFLCALVPAPAAGQVIRGQVVDSASGAGVPLARVVVTGTSHRFNRRMFTAADGRFAFPVRRGGSFRVQVTRAGYADARRSVAVGAGDTVHVNLRVTPTAHRLEPVTVTARPRRLRVVGVFGQTSDSIINPVRAAGRARSVWIGGTFVTPNPCYRLSGNADRRGSVITLTVQARAYRGLCDTAGGAFGYDVLVRRVPPGTYTLRVLHAYQNDVAEPLVALQTTVSVR
jgi:hypothetical protein